MQSKLDLSNGALRIMKQLLLSSREDVNILCSHGDAQASHGFVWKHIICFDTIWLFDIWSKRLIRYQNLKLAVIIINTIN